MSGIDSQQYDVAEVGFSTIGYSRVGRVDRNVDKERPISKADRIVSIGGVSETMMIVMMISIKHSVGLWADIRL